MRNLVSMLVVAALAVTMCLGAIPSLVHALRPQVFAKHCLNKSRPELHCKGKCRMMQANAKLIGSAGTKSMFGEAQAPGSAPSFEGLPPDGWQSAPISEIASPEAWHEERGLRQSRSPEPPPPKG